MRADTREHNKTARDRTRDIARREQNEADTIPAARDETARDRMLDIAHREQNETDPLRDEAARAGEQGAAHSEGTRDRARDTAHSEQNETDTLRDAHSEGAPAHTHGHTHTKSVLNRLARAIGHLTAVRGMVERGRDCPEVLIQLAAVRAAINGICEVILKDHLEHCVVNAIQTGDTEALEELKQAVKLLMK